MSCFTRDFYIGYSGDKNAEFEEKMNEILGEHDVNKLHDYLSKGFHSNYHYPALLDLCLDRRSIECALHIIQGNLPHGPPILAADHCEPKPRLPVLYHAIHCMCEPEVFKLLLHHCQAANQVSRPFLGLLPLHWLLDLLTEEAPFSDWSLGKPLSSLIDSLFLSQFRPKLECARILVEYTPSLEQVVLGYIKNGEIIPLAALLLVAPVIKGHFDIIKPYTSIESIGCQAIHGPYDSQATCYAAALLHIFEMDGDKLTSKFNSGQERLVEVSRGVLSSSGHKIHQTESFIFVRKLRAVSRQVPFLTRLIRRKYHGNQRKVMELFDPDTNLSFDQYVLLLRSLLKICKRNDAIRLLLAELSHLNEESLHSGHGLPTFICAICTFCNINEDPEKPFVPYRDVDLIYICLLQIVLTFLVKCDFLSKWCPDQSLVKLLLLLFLRSEVIQILECVKLIAERINSVNEVAWTLIRQGKLIQLAGLLLVAREKAMEPFQSGKTIRDAASMGNVVSEAIYGESVTATAGAAGLLEIFGRAGGTLTNYYWTELNDGPSEVIVEVAKIIQSAGIQVLSTDVDLSDIYSTSHPQMLKSIFERLGIKIDDTTQISGSSPFPSSKSVKERCRTRVSVHNYPTMDLAKSVEIFSEGFGLLGLFGYQDEAQNSAALS